MRYLISVVLLLAFLAACRNAPGPDPSNGPVASPAIDQMEQASITLSVTEAALASYRSLIEQFEAQHSHCKPCVEMIPAPNEYYRRGTANGMEMVIVNVDRHIAPEAFAQQHGVQLPILWAPQISNLFAHDYGANSVLSD
jgi:hypothetical protein